MAERKYTYRVEVDNSSLSAAETEIKKRLGGAMANIQAQPEAQRATQTTLADFQKLEAELRKIGQIDLTAPADKLKAKLDDLRQTARQLDADIRGSDVRGGGSTSPQYKAKLEDYYTALAQAQGDDAAALARGRGVVGNIGQLNAEFANDTRPADEFTQSAFAQVEEVRQKSREEIRRLMEMEARLYATQQAEAQAEGALIAQRIAVMEGQLATDDDGRILQAYSEAADEQERLAAAEVEAANSLAEIKKRLRQDMEQDAANAKKAALQSGDLSAAGGGGRLTVSVTQATAAQAGKLADELERAAKMEERIAGSVKDQIQANRQRQADELELVRTKGRQSAANESLIEQERNAGAAARAETQKTVMSHAEAEKRITVGARAEAQERAAIARRESAVKVEEAREARIRATEEERRQTAAYRAELSQRQRATTQSRGGTTGAGLGSLMGGSGALVKGGLAAVGLYGVSEIAMATDRFAQLGTTSQRSALAFDMLSGSTENATAKLSAVQRASGGAINKLEAMQIANKAAALQMANTAGELQRVTSFATIASRILGTDTAGALDQMALAAANLSFRRLDELGINASKARIEFAKLKGTMDDSAAFLQAMLIVGEETFAGMGESALGSATGMERLKTQVIDIKNSLAEITSYVISVPAEGLARILGADIPLAELQQRIDDAIAGLRDYADHPDVAGRYRLLLDLSAAIEQAKGRDAELHAQLVETGALIASMPGPPAGEFAAKADEMIQKANGLATAIAGVSETVYSLADAIQRVNDLGIPESIAGGLVTRFSPSYGPDMPGDIDSGNRNFASRLEGLQRQSAATREAAGLQAAMVRDVRDRFFKAIDEQEREQKRAAEKTAAEWKSAAKEAENAFTSAARAVPGLFGSSETNQSQMDRAGAGVPQNFADDYVRRLTDEVMNGVDWDNVDIGDAARRAGINPSLPAEIILDMFRESWDSGRLFADPSNLDLINLDAVRADMAAQRAGEAGQQNILNMLQGAGLGEAYGVSAAGQLAGGIAGAIPGEFEAANIGGTAGTAIVAQFSAPAAMQAWAQAGRVATEGIFTGYQSAIDASPFGSTLVQSITAAVMANLIGTFGPQNP